MLGDTTGQATGTLGAGQRRTRSPGLWDSEEKPSGGAVYTAVRCALCGEREDLRGIPQRWKVSLSVSDLRVF